MRTSNGGGFSVAANAQRRDVDNRISLKKYYRIADNLLKQVFFYFFYLGYISVILVIN